VMAKVSKQSAARRQLPVPALGVRAQRSRYRPVPGPRRGPRGRRRLLHAATASDRWLGPSHRRVLHALTHRIAAGFGPRNARPAPRELTEPRAIMRRGVVRIGQGSTARRSRSPVVV
jgi:hypothetical protein